MRVVKQCTKCYGISFYGQGDSVVCSNCYNKFNEIKISQIMKEYNCNTLAAVIVKAKTTPSLQKKLKEYGV